MPLVMKVDDLSYLYVRYFESGCFLGFLGDIFKPTLMEELKHLDKDYEDMEFLPSPSIHPGTLLP